MKLYEITDLYMKFYDMVESGEIEEDAIADTLESIDGEFEDKADNIASLIKTFLAEAEAIKTEEKNLKDRRERKERQAESLKNYISSTMLQLGKVKVETARNVLSFRKSTSLEILDEYKFMETYPELIKVEIKKSIPKKDITDLIKAGEEFDGVKLTERQNLQIK
jgi:hypothetical protein